MNYNYRKGIGVILLNCENKIICFRRADFPDSWQGPEGGIDDDESILNALKREVFEEIGLKQEDYEVIKQTSKPFKYLYNKNNKVRHFGFDGQEKIFFLLKLKRDNFNDFKYDNTDSIEFTEAKSLDEANDLIELVPNFKKELYLFVLKDLGLINGE